MKQPAPPSQPPPPAPDNAPPAGSTAAPAGTARAVGLIAAATMLSRILGLVREQFFAALLGASLFADAFNVAFRIPNLLRDLFAEGALAQAFVPTFKSELKRQGRSSAYALANRVAGTLLVVVGLVVLAGTLFAPEIVRLMAGDFAEVPGKFGLTVTLTRLMMPFLVIVSMSAVAMGMLNAQERFTAPALAPACFNVMSILTGASLYLAGVEGEWVAMGWAIGAVLGGLAQLGVQIPTLWRTGFRPLLRPDLMLRDPGVRRVALLMAPAVGGLAAVQLNIFINTMFASTEDGAVSWLNYAFRFLQLPIGVFGVAIATVSTTRYADAAADGDRDAMAAHLLSGLRLVLFLTVPATVGLVTLGEPIIRLIFERGAFTALDTRATADALELYATGLVAYAAVKVVAPAFYAMDMARIPVLASISAVAGNLLLNITLHPIYGYRVLALGTALAAVLNLTVLYSMFSRRIASPPHLALLRYLTLILVAAALMGAAVIAVRVQLIDLVGTEGLLVRLLGALGPVLVGVLVYAGICRAFRIEELTLFLRRVRRRRR
ncbi:murein biosynthesis integral membrane protein MurJ [Haliangium ochraceum]|uniref:Probable lipid II flippase MurJ n=1 Tax=Haliangium ochraceum (strain DSM 14365 / JCM 11303 / SMP-2) TaxID=502025 RepID=D0LJD3_HALO1|nr:murein biosynthesis integral membrane protein MurJ [Haliangium ochraceum]ACY14980.1 integral membrane protein MviN [Haliangium ochraceum DSM 14365]